jgi:hypothetical protein
VTYYKTVRVPRLGVYLPAHWDDEMVFIVPRFQSVVDALNFYVAAFNAGLQPSELCTESGKYIWEATPEEIQASAYFDFIINLYGEEAQAVWDAGEILGSDDADYPTFFSLIEIVR